MLQHSTQSGAESPVCALRALLQVEHLPECIWEPAAGRGAIVEVLRVSGHKVVASDLIDYGFPLDFVGDYLVQAVAPTGCQCILTNAPFKIIDRFIAHALELCPTVIVLARLALLESRRRTAILEHRGLARVHVFRERLPMMHRDGWAGPKASSAMAFAWFVWERGHTGPIIIDRISIVTAGAEEKKPGVTSAGSICALSEGDCVMTNTQKPKLEAIEGALWADKPVDAAAEAVTEEMLDADEAEFTKLRRDLPGVKGASALGIVTITVSAKPVKNEFFRTHPTFCPEVMLVQNEEGMEKHFYAVDTEMEVPLKGIGITCVLHKLYLIVTPRGATRIIPINCEIDNEWTRTKEIGLLDGREQWVRIYSDKENTSYKVFPAPAGRFADPIWPDLKPSKIFRLAFRDKGRLIDSPEHPLFKKWDARDR